MYAELLGEWVEYLRREATWTSCGLWQATKGTLSTWLLGLSGDMRGNGGMLVSRLDMAVTAIKMH